VDGAAHDEQPDRLTGLQRLGQHGRLEVTQPSGEREVRRLDILRLEPEQVMDHGEGSHGHPLEQVLTLQEGAVEDPFGEHGTNLAPTADTLLSRR